MNEQEMRSEFIATLLIALLGEVGPALRGVTYRWTPHKIDVVGYFDGPICDDDKWSMSEVETHLLAHYTDPKLKIKVAALRLDMPTDRNPKCLDEWIYSRREWHMWETKLKNRM